MKARSTISFILCGALAGAVNGLFGAGGGMILVPLLVWLTDLSDREVFPASVCMIAPLCIITLSVTDPGRVFPWKTAIPYLIGSAVGGVLAGVFAKKIPTKILHCILGVIILWGGIRYLC